MSLPTISIIVVNYNGQRHLDACLRSLVQQDYPSELVEIVLVDNGSTDGSLDFLREHYPQVRVLENASNLGFAPAVNQGARAATSEYVALINNDAYAAPNWLAELVAVAERRRPDGAVCIASRMLDWYGKLVDFDGGGISFYGYGGQRHFRLPVDRVQVSEGPILFACGGAMLVERAVFLDAGGFDESYFAYFEDVDFGWRLWVLGHEVWFAPQAVVYHRHHGTSGGSQAHQRYTLLERNALATIIKNYDDASLAKVLPATLLLLLKKSVMSGGNTIKRPEFDITNGPLDPSRGTVPTAEVLMPALSYMVGTEVLLNDVPGLYMRRAAIQSRRQRPDSAILPLFQQPFARRYPTPEYAIVQEQLVQQFGLDQLFSEGHPQRVVIFSSDPIRSELAGTGIRALEIARVLAASCQVTLAAPEEACVDDERIETFAFQYSEQTAVEELCKECDVIIAQGLMLEAFPFLRTTDVPLVIDIYTPFVLENLEQTVRHPRVIAEHQYEQSSMAIERQLIAGDFFICASERQRDFWMGALVANGRVNPTTYRDDKSLRQLLDVAPFGISSTPPRHTRDVLKGVRPGIDADDTLLIWNGGIWEWFDPLTVLRALAVVREQRPKLKLFFMGAGHPNKAGVPHMPMSDRTLELSNELGLTGTTVFFNDTWVPYTERGNYLLEADIGVSAHFDTAETQFSFRTRLLDCIWAGLPMIVSSGDTLADTVAKLGLGRVIAPEDVDGWAEALLDMSAMANRRAHFAPAFTVAQEHLRWERTLEPLVRFCRAPRHAPDTPAQRARQHIRATAASSEAVRDAHAYAQSLEEQIARKNAHIEQLERGIKAMENGRVMRLLGRVKGKR